MWYVTLAIAEKNLENIRLRQDSNLCYSDTSWARHATKQLATHTFGAMDTFEIFLSLWRILNFILMTWIYMTCGWKSRKTIILTGEPFLIVPACSQVLMAQNLIFGIGHYLSTKGRSRSILVYSGNILLTSYMSSPVFAVNFQLILCSSLFIPMYLINETTP